MKILAAISFGLAVAVSGLFLVLPTYSISSSESPSVGHATLLQVNGPRALDALTIPVLILLVPVLFPKWWVRIVAGLVLAAFVVVGGFSFGLFYFPSAAFMLRWFAIIAGAETMTARTITRNILVRLFSSRLRRSQPFSQSRL